MPGPGDARQNLALRLAKPSKNPLTVPQVVSQQRTLTPFTHDKGFFVAGLRRIALQASLVAVIITGPQLAVSGGSALTFGAPT